MKGYGEIEMERRWKTGWEITRVKGGNGEEKEEVDEEEEKFEYKKFKATKKKKKF